jgi:hypothetical protein
MQSKSNEKKNWWSRNRKKIIVAWFVLVIGLCYGIVTYFENNKYPTEAPPTVQIELRKPPCVETGSNIYNIFEIGESKRRTKSHVRPPEEFKQPGAYCFVELYVKKMPNPNVFWDLNIKEARFIDDGHVMIEYVYEKSEGLIGLGLIMAFLSCVILIAGWELINFLAKRNK